MKRLNLIACNEWLGPSRYANVKTEPLVRIVSFASAMSLEDSLQRLADYQRNYNAKHYQVLAVNLTVFAVSQIELVDDKDLRFLGVSMVEELDLTP